MQALIKRAAGEELTVRAKGDGIYRLPAHAVGLYGWDHGLIRVQSSVVIENGGSVLPMAIQAVQKSSMLHLP